MGGKYKLMTAPSPSNGYTLRQADSTDAGTIRQIISQAHINPTGLAWQRFILAIDEQGNTIACGQLKPHGDGSLELASIAVTPEWRGKRRGTHGHRAPVGKAPWQALSHLPLRAGTDVSKIRFPGS